MDTLILLKLLGIYMIISGLTMLLRGKTLVLAVKDLLGHRALMWLAGFFLIILGGSLALEPLGLVWASVLGWLILIKGVIYIVYPELFIRFFSKKGLSGMAIYGIIAIALGAWLLWVGF